MYCGHLEEAVIVYGLKANEHFTPENGPQPSA